jgi:hypothetical protein
MTPHPKNPILRFGQTTHLIRKEKQHDRPEKAEIFIGKRHN